MSDNDSGSGQLKDHSEYKNPCEDELFEGRRSGEFSGTNLNKMYEGEAIYTRLLRYPHLRRSLKALNTARSIKYGGRFFGQKA